MTASTFLLANPASGSGRGARALPAATRALQAIGDVVIESTAASGDEARLVARALDAGHDTIAVLGGDGTWSKAARALVTLGGDARLALLAAGTGNDLARSVGAPARDYVAMARLIASGGARRIDAARVDEHVYVNIAGFGFDAAVLDAMRHVRWLRGAPSYAVAAVRELFGYRGFEARVALDGTSVDDGAAHRWLGLFLANGAHFGGGFRIAPDAALDDGLLDVVTLDEASAWRRVRLLAAATRGAHVALPEVRTRRARVVTLGFTVPPLYEADGELHRAGAAEVHVRTIPGALRIVADR
jgi:diacylglycerol kinase (ATP)